MDKAAEVVSEIVKGIIKRAEVGVNLLVLEQVAEGLMTILNATSANKGYHPSWAKIPFPSSICLGVNDVIVHGVPTDYVLKDGDLLTIDCGILVGNFAGDCGVTIPIGTISGRDTRLLRYTKRALLKGISVIKPGVKVTEVGKAIENYVRVNGFVVNKRFTGHGIGKAMHEEPRIPHYNIGQEEIVEVLPSGKKKYIYKEYDNIPIFQVGQVICIEPHLTYRDEYGTLDKDGWTVRTRDGRNSAFAEEMVRVTELGAEILTTHI